MALKTTYKAPGITCTCTSTFKPFLYMHVYRNKHDLSENHSCMIQISSKVFSIRVCKKSQKPGSYFFTKGGWLVTVGVDVSRTNCYRGVRLSWAKSYRGYVCHGVHFSRFTGLNLHCVQNLKMSAYRVDYVNYLSMYDNCFFRFTILLPFPVKT